MVNDNIIGIFYIATGVYKNYFQKFIETINYCFPNKTKKLIIISDGLKEYDNMYINGVNITVEDFISYPYPYININKFQIIHHYAKKYKINNIVYFDSETYFFEKEESFYDDLLKQSKDKLISLIPSYFIKYTFRDFIYVVNTYTLWGQDNNFRDFDYFYSDNYDNININYKWIQTSFFICSFDILSKINNLLKDLILYNNRITGNKLNYSDELYINYLNLYYPELFHCDFYGISNDDDIPIVDSMFFYQKMFSYIEKQKLKFGGANYNFRMIMFNINSDNDINKFFIKHIHNFLLTTCNSHTINNMIFFNSIILSNEWFDDNHNIILERSFYSNKFLQLYENSDQIYIGFINKINEFTDNFNYDEFYDNDYDCIEGYDFDDIKNIKFNDIEMCCFSKRYIEAYFNNDNSFKPKKYKI